jgi:glutathione S-transferase
MANYVDVPQARTMAGLRIVATPGSIAPWSEALKQIFDLKRVPYVLVAQQLPGPDLELQEWTAQNSAPVAVWNDERPRSTWLEQLYLAERLAPAPPLIPAAIQDRILMMGLINEIGGETGLAWCGRLRFLHAQLRAAAAARPAAGSAADQARVQAQQLGAKYGYTAQSAEGATAKMVQVLQGLSAQLERQRARGSRFLVGDGLTALDIYWAAFCNTFDPPPAQWCPAMPDNQRTAMARRAPAIDAALSPGLIEHRDYVYRTWLKLPIDF